MPKYWISKEGSLKTKKRPMREIKRERERGEFEDPKNRQVTTLSSKARFAELILKGPSWDTQFKRIQIPAFGEPEAVSFVFGKFSTIGEGMKKKLQHAPVFGKTIHSLGLQSLPSAIKHGLPLRPQSLPFARGWQPKVLSGRCRSSVFFKSQAQPAEFCHFCA